MWPTRHEFGWRSDVGLVRSRNEDAIAVLPDLGLVVVADGIGGARSGDVASRIAAEVIAGRFQRQSPSRGDADKARLFVEAAIEEANAAIRDHAQREKDCVGMGTTVVVGFLGRGWLAFASVGDSRLYLMRDGTLKQLTRDHSFIQEVVDQGFFRSLEDAKHYGIGDNILTRALGTGNHVQVASGLMEVRSGDLYLFCTDGLSGMVPDAWLEQMLTLGEGKDLDTLTAALVELACARGGNDNITLGLVRIA
jgi:PPM family protein phosphatase